MHFPRLTSREKDTQNLFVLISCHAFIANFILREGAFARPLALVVNGLKAAPIERRFRFLYICIGGYIGIEKPFLHLSDIVSEVFSDVFKGVLFFLTVS